MTDVARGSLTGLPLSHFATAELVARARAAGFINLWDYVAALEAALVAAADLLAVTLRELAAEREGGYTCPRCGMTSHNPNDARESYCGHCHDWTAGG